MCCGVRISCFPSCYMLRRSLPPRTSLWSLENDSVYLKKQQFLCEGMGLLGTCSMHWRRAFPFSPSQVIAYFFMKARKAMLRQGEWQRRRAEVREGSGVGLDTSRAASAGITGMGMGQKNGVQKTLSLLNWQKLWGWGSQVSNSPTSTVLCQGSQACMGRCWELQWQGTETSVVVYCFCSYLSVMTATQLCPGTCANLWKELCEWVFLLMNSGCCFY